MMHIIGLHDVFTQNEINLKLDAMTKDINSEIIKEVQTNVCSAYAEGNEKNVLSYSKLLEELDNVKFTEQNTNELKKINGYSTDQLKVMKKFFAFGTRLVEHFEDENQHIKPGPKSMYYIITCVCIFFVIVS